MNQVFLLLFWIVLSSITLLSLGSPLNPGRHQHESAVTDMFHIVHGSLKGHGRADYRRQQHHHHPKSDTQSKENISKSQENLKEYPNVFKRSQVQNVSDTNTTTSTTNDNTNEKESQNAAFLVDFECESSLMVLNDSLCSWIEYGLERALTRLSAVIYLPETVKVTAVFSSICGKTVSCVGDGTGVLASAAPSAWFRVNESIAMENGLDPDYLYPSALLRQYIPNDPIFQENQSTGKTYDIHIQYNADINWWISNPTNPTGDSDQANHSNGPNSIDGDFISPFQAAQYDLELVTIHEMLHGLGFISSWYSWTDNTSIILPAWVDFDPSSNDIIGLGYPYIYDRFLTDNNNQIWLSTYSDFIRQVATDVAKNISTVNPMNFLNILMQTDAGTIIDYVSDQVVTSSYNIMQWFPTIIQSDAGTFSTEQMQNMDLLRRWKASHIPSVDWPYQRQKDIFFLDFYDGNHDQYIEIQASYMVIYSPETFRPGSSLSHVDSLVYEGSCDFLMRPFATGGIGADAYEPLSKYGPLSESVLLILRSMGYVTAIGSLYES